MSVHWMNFTNNIVTKYFSISIIPLPSAVKQSAESARSV